MPLYELVCIAVHQTAPNMEMQQLVTSLATRVMRSGGVVRDIRNLGSKTLPVRFKRHQQYHSAGDHFTMLFDTSPPVLARINETLKNDPGVIKWTLINQGSRIRQLLPKREFTAKSTPMAGVQSLRLFEEGF